MYTVWVDVFNAIWMGLLLLKGRNWKNGEVILSERNSCDIVCREWKVRFCDGYISSFDLSGGSEFMCQNVVGQFSGS